jgi:hypothetical protein
MGQMVYDPVVGKYVYQPDWWELQAQDKRPGMEALDPMLDTRVVRPVFAGDEGGSNALPSAGPMANAQQFQPQYAGGDIGGPNALPPGLPMPGPDNPIGGAAESAFGPTGALAGSSAQYPDETGRGLGAPGVGGMGGLSYGPTGAITGSSARYPDETGRGLGAPGVAGMGGLGGFSSGPGPTGAIGGSSAQYPDEMTRLQNRQANGPSATGPGDSDWFRGEGVDAALYSDPHTGMRRMLRASGSDPDTNPFDQAALARFSVPVMQALYDFWEVLNGGPTDDAEGMPQFMQEFMAGRINPTALIQQAQAKMAGGDEDMTEILDDLGSDDFTVLQESARGSTPRVGNARRRVMQRKVGRIKEGQLDDVANAKTTDWLKLIGGR